MVLQKKTRFSNFGPSEVRTINGANLEEPSFTSRATKLFSDSLTRQKNEGVRINNTNRSPGMIMNS
jgi:hypothetical protein